MLITFAHYSWRALGGADSLRLFERLPLASSIHFALAYLGHLRLLQSLKLIEQFNVLIKITFLWCMGDHVWLLSHSEFAVSLFRDDYSGM